MDQFNIIRRGGNKCAIRVLELVSGLGESLVQCGDIVASAGHSFASDSVRFRVNVLFAYCIAKASELVPQYGIELLDVQVKRLNYIEDVRKKVYERMTSERQRIASKYRSEGEGKKAEIVGSKERELNKIYSEAYKKSQEIRGEADAEATKIYADAYKLDPEFYSFLKTLEIYKKAVGENSRAILTTDSDIYRYLKRIRIR